MSEWLTIGSFWVATAAALASGFAVVISYLALRSRIDPDVIVYVKHDETRPTILCIVIENVGGGVAYDVEFALSAPIPAKAYRIESTGLKGFQEMDTGPFFTGIPIMAPGEKRLISWGQFGGLMDSLGREPVRVTASYYRKNQSGRTDLPKSTVSFLEVASFETTDASAPPDVRQVRHIEHIAKSLATGQRDLRTIAEVLRRTAEALVDHAEHHPGEVADDEAAPPKLPASPEPVAKKTSHGKAEKHGA